jgi:hypothetical protein
MHVLIAVSINKRSAYLANCYNSKHHRRETNIGGKFIDGKGQTNIQLAVC